jgi:hypothetical protein
MSVAGPPSKSIRAVLTSFRLSNQNYGLNQLRYDLRKLKGMDCSSVMAPVTPTVSLPKGSKLRCCFCSSINKRLCGPIANSRFHNRPDPHHRPNSKLEAAYHRADKAIQKIVDVLAAA